MSKESPNHILAETDLKAIIAACEESSTQLAGKLPAGMAWPFSTLVIQIEEEGSFSFRFVRPEPGCSPAEIEKQVAERVEKLGGDVTASTRGGWLIGEEGEFQEVVMIEGRAGKLVVREISEVTRDREGMRSLGSWRPIDEEMARFFASYDPDLLPGKL